MEELRAQLGLVPWSLNRFQGPPRSQHSPLLLIHRLVLNHVCGWKSCRLEGEGGMVWGMERQED